MESAGKKETRNKPKRKTKMGKKSQRRQGDPLPASRKLPSDQRTTRATVPPPAPEARPRAAKWRRWKRRWLPQGSAQKTDGETRAAVPPNAEHDLPGKEGGNTRPKEKVGRYLLVYLFASAPSKKENKCGSVKRLREKRV